MAWIDTAPSSAADHAPAWGVVKNVAPEVISRVAKRALIIPLSVRLDVEITYMLLIFLSQGLRVRVFKVGHPTYSCVLVCDLRHI